MPVSKYEQSFEILSRRELCPNTWHLQVHAPLVAAKIEAGQFVVVRPNDHSERMPLSIAGWDRQAGTLTLIIAAAGFTSTEATQMQVGDRFADLVGPLGMRSHVAKYDGACVVRGAGRGAAADRHAGEAGHPGQWAVAIIGRLSQQIWPDRE